MSRHISSVLDIKPGMKKRWTVLVQVIEVAHPQSSKSGTTEFIRLKLADNQGTLFNAVIFGSDFQQHANLLIPYNRYYISNAFVTTNDSAYRCAKYPYSWTLNSRTLVEGLGESTPQKLVCTFDFNCFESLQKHADSNVSPNIKAVVLHCFPIQEHGSDSKISTKRDIVIVNEEKKLMLLSLWNKFAQVDGTHLENMIETAPILYGMRLKVTTFNSLSLFTRLSSGIMINPPTDEASLMKKWYNENEQELKQLLTDKAYKNADLLLPYPKKEDIVPVARITSSTDILKAGWVKGKTTLPEQDRSCWYTICANCQKTLDADPSWVVTCPGCKLQTKVEARSRLAILIDDGIASMRATICSPEIEKLMPFTPERLKDAEENDIDFHKEIAKSVNQHTIVAFVRSYETTFHGQPQTNINIIKVYKSRDIILPTPLTNLPEEEKLPDLTTPSKLVKRPSTSIGKGPTQEPASEENTALATPIVGTNYPAKKTKKVNV